MKYILWVFGVFAAVTLVTTILVTPLRQAPFVFGVFGMWAGLTTVTIVFSRRLIFTKDLEPVRRSRNLGLCHAFGSHAVFESYFVVHHALDWPLENFVHPLLLVPMYWTVASLFFTAIAYVCDEPPLTLIRRKLGLTS